MLPADFRIQNTQYADANTALTNILVALAKSPTSKAVVRVADEDAANQMQALLDDIVDRISFEFDSTELGPNPLWTPSKLRKDRGRVVLYGPYGQTLHTIGIDASKGNPPMGRTDKFNR